MATHINIPYRCPECGKNTFSTLQDLRTHLQAEHASLIDRSHHQGIITSISHSDHRFECSLHSSLLELYHTDARKLEEIVKMSKEDELKNKRCRTQCLDRVSKGSVRDCLPRATFREYGHSSRTARHLYPKTSPSKEKSRFANLYTQLHYSSDEDLKDNSSLFADTQLPIKNSGYLGQGNERALLYLASHSNNETRSYKDLYFKQPQNRMTNDKHIINTLTALSQDVLLERASQQATADSLYTTQEVLSGVEQAAEERVVQQQHLINTLTQELKEKERKLASLMHEMDSLHQQQLAGMETVNFLNQKYEEEKTDVYKELNKKQIKLDCINKEITEAKQKVNENSENTFQKCKHTFPEAVCDQEKPTKDMNPSSQNVKEIIQHGKVSASESSEKDTEMTSIKKKSAKLEKDRQTLITEMQNLLQTAAIENDKLRAQLDDQTEKLCKLNSDLKQSKEDQADLLDETNTLYHQADVSLSLLKTMLKEREQQLKNVSSSLQQTKSTQEKLEHEKNECLKQSQEREAMFKSLLEANSSQVKSVKEILELSQEEKLKLQEELCKMRDKLAAKGEEDRQLTDKMSKLQVELAVKEKTYAAMKAKVRRREDKLRKARQEMERVTTYLKVTAKKEIEARSSLETVISGLISRAGKAEAELQQVKSSQVPHFSRSSAQVVQNKVQPRHDLYDNSASVSYGTSRLELPDKIHFQDRNQKTSQWMDKHNPASGKLNAGQLKYLHKQVPKAGTEFEVSHPSEVRLYPSSLQQGPSHLLFENTPEMERMIQNVDKFERTKSNDRLYSHKLHKVKEKDRARQSTPGQRELWVTDLPLDANGIMWEEQRKTTYTQKDANPVYNKSLLLTQGVEHLKSNDDTDVDEELTDYVQEEDLIPYPQSNIFVKSHQTTPSNISKTTMAAFQTNPLPLDEKVVKLLSSLEDTGSQDINTHVSTHSLHGSKQNKKSQRDKTLKENNDFSATDSELSPLHKARAVQKRVERLTAMNSSFPPAHLSSKQSVGFEISHLDQESDVSSSSYASLGHPQNQLFQKENKRYIENIQWKAPKESVKCADVITSEVRKNLNSGEIIEGDKVECNNCISLEPSQDTTDVATTLFNNKAVASLSAAHSTDKNNAFEENTNTKKQLTNMYQGDITEDLKINRDHSSGEVKDIEKELDNNCNGSIKEITDMYEDHKYEDKEDIETQLINANNEDSKEINILQSKDQVLENDKGTDKQITNTFNGVIEAVDVPTSENHILGEETLCHILQDKEPAIYTNTMVVSADELQAQVMSHSETQVSSSEEDLFDNSRKKSVDATTDTDLEKLALPGHLQKGFIVRKRIHHRKQFTRRKSRQRAMLQKSQSQESLSSEMDDVDTTQKSRRQAVRRMRIALFRVFSYLDTRTLLTVSCVSKEWNRVSRHPALWKHVRLANSTISSSVQGMHGLHGRSIMAEETPEGYQQAIRGSVEPGLEALLSSCHDTIKVLHISDCDNILTDKCLWLVSGYCRLLTSLTYQSSVDPVTPQLIWALGGGCPGITSLYVHPQQPCEKKNAMNNKCLLLIGQLYPDIEELGLGGHEFDKAGLLPLIQSCQRLKSLVLDHCLPMTTDLVSTLGTAGLKYLQSLRISGTYVEAKAVKKFKECCKQLNKIHVSVNIQDCVDDPSSKKGKENYKKMVKALEVLNKELGFGVTFTLEATPV